MFESEINWLDTYFGSNAVTTEEYVQHDNRKIGLKLYSKIFYEKLKKPMLKEFAVTGRANSDAIKTD